MTEVVAALIWDGDRFLICQRPKHKARLTPFTKRCNMGLFAKKYKVDYCGQKMAYPNAKDEAALFFTEHDAHRYA